MKIARLGLLILLLVSKAISANGDNTIIEAIKASDPEALRYLLIPGFYIQNEEKKRYLSLAKGITNRTYVELHKNSWSDLIRGAQGAAKLIGTVGCGYLWHYFYPEGAQVNDENNPGRTEIVWPWKMTKEQLASTGFLSALTVYLFYKGIEEFRDILGKQDRLEHHRNALAVEAIIQRLPLCAEPVCATPGATGVPESTNK